MIVHHTKQLFLTFDSILEISATGCIESTSSIFKFKLGFISTVILSQINMGFWYWKIMIFMRKYDLLQAAAIIVDLYVYLVGYHWRPEVQILSIYVESQILYFMKRNNDSIQIVNSCLRGNEIIIRLCMLVCIWSYFISQWCWILKWIKFWVPVFF